MGFDFVFALKLVLVALLILGAIAGAFYIASSNRRGGEPGDGTEGRSGSAEQRAQADPHEFYKRSSLENDEDMKMHLYSVNEYEMEFGRDLHSRGGSRFVAALKSYRPVGDEWYALPPERAARVPISHPTTTRSTASTECSCSTSFRTASLSRRGTYSEARVSSPRRI